MQLSYWGTGRHRYQVEFPEALTENLGNEWKFASKRKGYKRFRHHDIDCMFDELRAAEQLQEEDRGADMRGIFADLAAGYVAFGDFRGLLHYFAAVLILSVRWMLSRTLMFFYHWRVTAAFRKWMYAGRLCLIQK